MNCLKYLALLVALFAFLLSSSGSAYAANEWIEADSMNFAHGITPLVKLLDGRYMVVSGPNTCCSQTNTVEIYNENTQQWELTGSTNLARDQFTPVLLNDGRVLIAGGSPGQNIAHKRAEIYNPVTGVWTEIVSMNTERRAAVYIKLQDGRVLAISGGNGDHQPLYSTEIYDPVTDVWTYTGDVINPIWGGDSANAVVLNDGRVLLIGNFINATSSTTQIYNPSSGTWSAGGNLVVPRHTASMVKLQDGRVLLMGGVDGSDTVADAEIFDPSTNQWTQVSPLNQKRHVFNGVLLPNGKVFISGGYDTGIVLYSSEVYDPVLDTWTTVSDDLLFEHGGGKLAMLSNGDIMMIGGWASGSPSPKTEMYTYQEDENDAPIAGTITVSPNPVQINTLVNVSAPFTDEDSLDSHTAVWDWGDGTSSPGSMSENNGSGTVSGTHSYTSSGVYTITLTIEDNEGLGDTQVYEYVSVYNPTNQSRFNGVRLFTSPVGALQSDPNFTGKAQFGIRANYDGTSAAGDVNLHMLQANFNFESTSLNVLVITNNIAYIRGSGILNGIPGYTYFIKGTDDTLDTVRFQIKDASGVVVYDTQPGASDIANTTITITGQIIIH